MAQESHTEPAEHSLSVEHGATQRPVPNWQRSSPQSSWVKHPEVVVPVDDTWLEVPELVGWPDVADTCDDPVLAPEPSPPEPSSSNTTLPPHPNESPRLMATIVYGLRIPDR